MSSHDMNTPEVWLKNGEYRLQLNLRVGAEDDVAAAFETAAEIISRIEGDYTGGSTLSKRLRHAAGKWRAVGYPQAANVAQALASWASKPLGYSDFEPCPDDSALVAAIRKSARLEERAAIVEWLRTEESLQTDGGVPLTTVLLIRDGLLNGEHLRGDDDV
jgi:hypothetical protein